MSRRTDRVADQIARELTDLLLREVRDPRVRLATVSRVDVSPDLHHARALVSVLGSEDERAAALEALARRQAASCAPSWAPASDCASRPSSRSSSTAAPSTA